MQHLSYLCAPVTFIQYSITQQVLNGVWIKPAGKIALMESSLMGYLGWGLQKRRPVLVSNHMQGVHVSV